MTGRWVAEGFLTEEGLSPYSGHWGRTVRQHSHTQVQRELVDRSLSRAPKFSLGQSFSPSFPSAPPFYLHFLYIVSHVAQANPEITTY